MQDTAPSVNRLDSEQSVLEYVTGMPRRLDCDVQFHFHSPVRGLLQYTAYAKFGSTIEEYRDYTAALELRTRQETLTPHLPAAWELPRELSLPWWDAETTTPDNATAASIDDDGWLVAKHENDYVYVIVAGQVS